MKTREEIIAACVAAKLSGSDFVLVPAEVYGALPCRSKDWRKEVNVRIDWLIEQLDELEASGEAPSL